MIPIATARRAAGLIAGAELLELDSGHSPHASLPDEVATGIRRLTADS